jgi:dimethylargininase
MLTALPDGTIIGDESLVEDVKVFERFVAMPEPEGVAVVHLAVEPDAGASLIMSASAPRSLKLLQDLGYKVTTTDVTEFEVSLMKRGAIIAKFI